MTLKMQDDLIESGQVTPARRFFKKETLVSFLVAFALLVFLFTRLDLDWAALWRNITSSDPLLFLLAFVIYYFTFPIRGFRWLLLLNNIGLKRAKGIPIPSFMGLGHIIFLGWFGNCVVPAKLGDAYRGYLLKKEANVSFSSTVGTIVAERVVDMVVLFSMMALAAFSFLGSSLSNIILQVLLAGGAMVIVLVLGLVFIWGLGQHQGRLPDALQGMYSRFQTGTFGSFRQLPMISALSILVWLMEAARLFYVTKALNLSLGLPFILFVSLANSLLTAVPFTPGGLGLVEAGVVGLLVLSPAVDNEMAVSVALLDRAISYWSLVGFGAIVFLFGNRH